ncbi:MAG: prephenate dehydrogenase/arogenate dehydrogenase family protein [Candidatus Omnitrophica bacterium]|nr:prephenate dehydrogenase/arogenate dehydrogenase family protein [Candidatus Omnitrophota bacterium]
MKLFEKIAIVGTGLIGGSLAQAARKNKLCDRLIGVSRHKATLEFAKRHKIIDSGSQDISILKDADLVILATPPQTIKILAPKIKKIIKNGCIVTDVASIKSEIVSSLEKIFPDYIGSHPLAGLEKRGIQNANARIFNDSLCILTPTKKTSLEAGRKIKLFWRALGVEVITMTPKEHDKVLSFVSHLPHVSAFSLMDAIPDKFLDFAAGGFKDTTRIAASDPELWAEIILGNQKDILYSVGQFKKSLRKITSAIRGQNKKALIAIIKSAKERREKLNSL